MSNTTAPASASILDSYVMTVPTSQNLIDIFKGEWACSFPPPFGHLQAGGIPAFQDNRLIWGLDRLGGVVDQNVLELGPLEGEHSFILERAGAAHVTAIEANSRALLKCLISKEILGLSRTRFLLGNFITYLENSPQQFGTIVAAGVLYHMKQPLHLLDLISRHTCKVYIWTHYFDEKIIGKKPEIVGRFLKKNTVSLGKSTIIEHRHDYQASLEEKSYSGGGDNYSTWLSREGLMAALKEFGFNDIEVNFETPDHPHGPALSLVARKS